MLGNYGSEWLLRRKARRTGEDAVEPPSTDVPHSVSESTEFVSDAASPKATTADTSLTG